MFKKNPFRYFIGLKDIGLKENLLESKLWMQTIYDQSNDAILLLDIEQDRIVDFNKKAISLLEYSKEELPNISIMTIHSHEMENFKNFTETVNHQGKGTSHQLSCHTKTGKYVPVEISASAVEIKQKKYILAIVRDISSRLQADEDLNRYKSMISNSSDMQSLIDSNYVYIAINPAYCSALNKSSEEIIGMTIAEVLGDDFFNDFVKPNADRCLNGKDVHYQVWVDFPNIGRRYMDASYSPYYGIDNKIMGFVATSRDITDREEIESALRRSQKMDAIGELSGGIAHDFNNILGIILGNVNLLKPRVKNDPEALKRIKTIISSAQRAVDLTRQLLGFSSRHPTQIVATDINQLIKKMHTLYSASLTPQMEVKHNFTEDLWFTNIDPGDFEDVLLNLVLNARDAMDNRGKLTLSTCNTVLDETFCTKNPGAKPGEYIELTVSDEGEGIAANMIEHIFEPFFTTKAEGKGTGLGLAMVYGFVKRSEAFIQVLSEINIGTSFKLYLPRTTKQPASIESKAKKLLPEITGQATILVVDDEKMLVELASETLQSYGFQVITACNGIEALDKLAENPAIELIFSDVVMPGGINGYELAEIAIHKKPSIKILLTSGYSDKADIKSDQLKYFNNLLNKPYHQDELVKLINEHINTDKKVLEKNPIELTKATDKSSWADDLKVGMESMDEDHQYLFKILNRCQQASENYDQPLCKTLLSELREFTLTHLPKEENLMKSYGFPGLENHIQVHNLLIKKLDETNKQQHHQQPASELLNTLRKWWIDHESNMDRAFANFSKTGSNTKHQPQQPSSPGSEKPA